MIISRAVIERIGSVLLCILFFLCGCDPLPYYEQAQAIFDQKTNTFHVNLDGVWYDDAYTGNWYSGNREYRFAICQYTHEDGDRYRYSLYAIEGDNEKNFLQLSTDSPFGAPMPLLKKKELLLPEVGVDMPDYIRDTTANGFSTALFEAFANDRNTENTPSYLCSDSPDSLLLLCFYDELPGVYTSTSVTYDDGFFVTKTSDKEYKIEITPQVAQTILKNLNKNYEFS